MSKLIIDDKVKTNYKKSLRIIKRIKKQFINILKKTTIASFTKEVESSYTIRNSSIIINYFVKTL